MTQSHGGPPSPSPPLPTLAGTLPTPTFTGASPASFYSRAVPPPSTTTTSPSSSPCPPPPRPSPPTPGSAGTPAASSVRWRISCVLRQISVTATSPSSSPSPPPPPSSPPMPISPGTPAAPSVAPCPKASSASSLSCCRHSPAHHHHHHVPLLIAVSSALSSFSNSDFHKYAAGYTVLILGGAAATYCYVSFPPTRSTACSGAMLGYHLSFPNLIVPTLAASKIQIFIAQIRA